MPDTGIACHPRRDARASSRSGSRGVDLQRDKRADDGGRPIDPPAVVGDPVPDGGQAADHETQRDEAQAAVAATLIHVRDLNTATRSPSTSATSAGIGPMVASL